ncbi:hypothetical protein KEM48_001649 [Puccinia striiformis f. sp. tritici PST-130]|nr:hypothetical protein KEM48_001649 [Puccinia striiformis f. sp. tritici PST-130]
MSQISWLSRGLNVGRSVFLLGSKNRQPLSTSVNPNREPSRPIKESSEQAVGGTTDDIAHSGDQDPSRFPSLAPDCGPDANIYHIDLGHLNLDARNPSGEDFQNSPRTGPDDRSRLCNF